MVHHLDHVGPFCSLIGIPLVVTDEEIARLAKTYYPDLRVIYWNYIEISFKLAEQFNTVFSSMARPFIEDIFFLSQKLTGKKLTSIWLPHGNSDKGHASVFMEGLKEDLYACVYGQKMIDFLKIKGAFHQLKACIPVGNFRYTYYLKYKDFYDNLIQQVLPVSQSVILYAPTWKDQENSTSFYEACPSLIDHIPDNHHLVIKLHPNLTDLEVDRWIDLYHHKQNVTFLREWTPIYPLLNKTSVYIGDMSSIGYDFLTFNRPMFFLNQNQRSLTQDPGLFLHQAGISLMPNEYSNIYTLMQQEIPRDQEKFSSIRAKIYSYTFAT